MTTHSEEPGPTLTDQIIRLAIKAHRKLGPGLLESVYQRCLCWELQTSGLTFKTEVPLQVVYEDLRIERAYRADIIIEDQILIELKAVDHVLPIHEAQTRTYLRLSGCQIGLLMNFNAAMLKDGLRRFIP
jgi:GxxExxY protein